MITHHEFIIHGADAFASRRCLFVLDRGTQSEEIKYNVL